jgi:hypothetical protein
VTCPAWLSRVQIFPGTVTWDIADGWYGGTGAFPRVVPGWCWDTAGIGREILRQQQRRLVLSCSLVR